MQKSFAQALSAHILVGLLILAALLIHAVPALLAGLLAFTLCRALLTQFRLNLPSIKFPERLVTLLVGMGALAVLIAAVTGVARAMNGENLSDLLLTLAHTLEQSKQYLPASFSMDLPDTVVELKQVVADVAKEHAAVVAGVGTGALHGILLALVGWLVGCLAACRSPSTSTAEQPVFFQVWNTLWSNFVQAFSCVAFAQIKVASVNTVCMGIFLLIASPMLGWTIPYAKTLVLATFICGLLPVVGNLISNTLTTVMALTVSLPAALTALGVLMLIHKAEYLILSKALGAETGTKIWELLTVLFAGELMFGMPGMVTAPIIYTFARAELRRHGWLPPAGA